MDRRLHQLPATLVRVRRPLHGLSRWLLPGRPVPDRLPHRISRQQLQCALFGRTYHRSRFRSFLQLRAVAAASDSALDPTAARPAPTAFRAQTASPSARGAPTGRIVLTPVCRFNRNDQTCVLTSIARVARAADGPCHEQRQGPRASGRHCRAVVNLPWQAQRDGVQLVQRLVRAERHPGWPALQPVCHTMASCRPASALADTWRATSTPTWFCGATHRSASTSRV